MNNYKLIILDFDGTLCASHEAILYCIQKSYQSLLIKAPPHDFIDETIRAGLGMDNTLKTLNPELSNIEIQKLLATYEAIYLEEGEQKSKPFSKVSEVLAKLHLRGIILTVVSNKAVEPVKMALENFKLSRYISMIVGDTNALLKKPNPMAYNDFIKPKFSSISPHEILMVGDTPADLLFAQNIGADACWAEYGYGDRRACLALQPKYIIQHFLDILNIFT